MDDNYCVCFNLRLYMISMLFNFIVNICKVILTPVYLFVVFCTLKGYIYTREKSSLC